jgi:hypothetical protein
MLQCIGSSKHILNTINIYHYSLPIINHISKKMDKCRRAAGAPNLLSFVSVFTVNCFYWRHVFSENMVCLSGQQTATYLQKAGD